jgi:hypothetical protein
VFSRGDDRLSKVLLAAHANGAYLDGWSDTLSETAWDTAFAEHGIDPAAYLKERPREQALPWDFLDMGIEKGFLLLERTKAISGTTTHDCREGDCLGCGVCRPGIANIVRPEPEPMPLFGEPSAHGAYAYVLCLTKTAGLRFLSPREFQEMIRRAIRRAGLDAVYTQGFSPVMKLSTSPPTSYGIASLCEYVQIELKNPLNPDRLASLLGGHLPAGSSVVSCAEGKLRQVRAFTYTTHRPFSLSLEQGSCIIKDGKPLRVADYLEYKEPCTMRIAFRDGRTISPVLLLEAFSQDGVRLEEIVKTGTQFADDPCLPQDTAVPAS